MATRAGTFTTALLVVLLIAAAVCVTARDIGQQSEVRACNLWHAASWPSDKTSCILVCFLFSYGNVVEIHRATPRPAAVVAMTVRNDIRSGTVCIAHGTAYVPCMSTYKCLHRRAV